MNATVHKIKKAPKDRDLSEIFGFLRISGLAVPFLSVLGGYIGYTHYGLSGALLGILLAAGGGILVSLAIIYVLDAVGGASGILFGKKRALWTTREQVQGLMSQARFNKDNQNFEASLEYINQVLEKDPHYPEALFLKAQILWHGFDAAESAKPFLDKIMSLTEPASTIHTHASSLYSELSKMDSVPGKGKYLRGVRIGLAEPRPTITERLSSFFLEDLKEKIEATPVARWAIGMTVVLAFLLLLLSAVMNLQIDTLEHRGKRALRTIKQVQDGVVANADSIQQTEAALTNIVSQTTVINENL